MIRLILFTAASSSQSNRAKGNIQALIDEHKDQDTLVASVDLLNPPEDAITYYILAIPTLLREEPEPAARLVGDLSDSQRVWKLLTN